MNLTLDDQLLTPSVRILALASITPPVDMDIPTPIAW